MVNGEKQRTKVSLLALFSPLPQKVYLGRGLREKKQTLEHPDSSYLSGSYVNFLMNPRVLI